MATITRPTLFLLPIVGWKEFVSFPKLGLGPLVAKIDTGARTAALHADRIEVTGKRVRFVIDKRTYRAPLVGQKRVKSSNGISELRPVIRATLQVGSKLLKTEITLTDRADMEVPMLLGREALKGRFIVNPARSFILSRGKKKTL